MAQYLFSGLICSQLLLGCVLGLEGRVDLQQYFSLTL